ncbi:MAG: NAD(P)/FAD-dependent oxidoreductase [Lewinellaceae bacterium]|nr:NAD(P)/FAD-dependent oxidoreductase [Lewinellaceae bacterium]
MKEQYQTETLIVGAGPAGLAVAGRLSKMGLPFLVLEKGDRIGASWHDHYERLHLHTVKEHSDLPHDSMPEHYPVYVPRLDLIAYWEDYVRKMNISPLFGQNVSKIRRENGGWITETDSGVFQSAQVVVATGYNRVPNFPTWPGQEDFRGTFIHSRDYRSARPFAGQKVLIVGIGNTGAELALDLHEHGATPYISVRSPVNFIRRDIGGRPAQRTAIILGKLPDAAYDFIARLVQRLTVGDMSPYGLPKSPYAPSEQLRRFGKVPVIDIGTIDLIKQGHVKIMPDIQRFNEESVAFVDGRTEVFDAVIACTGYHARVEDFVENGDRLLSDWGYPRSLWFDDPAFEGLYFCGFSIPLSGILRNIKMDSAAIAERIGRRAGIPTNATAASNRPQG